MTVSIVTVFGKKDFELTEQAAEALVTVAWRLTEHPNPGPIKVECGVQQTLADVDPGGRWLLYGPGKPGGA